MYRKVPEPPMDTVSLAQQTLIWPYFSLYVLQKYIVSPKVHCFKYGNTCCIFIQSTDAGLPSQQWQFIPLSTSCTREYSSSSLVMQPLELSFGFSPTSVCMQPSSVCYLLRQEEAKAEANQGSLDHSCQREGGIGQLQMGCMGSA